MSIIGKCPKCEKSISEIVAVSVNVRDNQKSWKGGVFTCPHCNTILGAGLDPLATIDETVKRLIVALRK